MLPNPRQKIENDEKYNDNEINIRTKKFNISIDVSQCFFDIICIIKLREKELTSNLKTVKLDAFKVHDYNAKIIKTVQKYAEKKKLEFE